MNGILERFRDALLTFAQQLRDWWHEDSGELRRKAKMIIDTTSDQFFEKADETRKSVKIRMAIMDTEHSLNRVYTQIGKLGCDARKEGSKSIPLNKELLEKLELARQYRERLAELRDDQANHQQSSEAEG